jgi:hypothetical protein
MPAPKPSADVKDLAFRDAAPSDFAQCLSLLASRLLCDPGAEARRHLLNYLRDHPEELRPYSLH